MNKFDLLLLLTVFLFVQMGDISAQEKWSLKWYKNSNGLYSPEHSPDNKKLVLWKSGPTSTFELYEVETGNLLWSISHNGADPTFSPDGSLISISDSYSNNEVYLLKANTGQVVKTFHYGYMNKFTSDSKYIIIASANTVYKLEIARGLLVWKFSAKSPIIFMKLSHDSMKLATYSEDGSIHVWNTQNGTLIWERRRATTFSYQTNLVFSPDDTKLLGYLESEKKIDLWNSNSGYLYWELDPYSVNNPMNLNKSSEQNSNYDNKAGYVHFIKNGSMIVFHHGNSISAASVDDASIIWSITCLTWATAVDKNGDRIVATSDEKILYIINANDGSILFKSEQASDYYSPMPNFSTDGKTLACVHSDGALELWTRERWINVTSLNNGEILQYPQEKNITWTNQNVSKVKIEYSGNNKVSWQLVADSIAASEGSFMWNIPNKNVEQCWIRVSDCDSTHIYNTNDSAFEIVMQPVTVNYPNGNERINGGSTQNIIWTKDTVSTISISFSQDNGDTWEMLSNDVETSIDSYEWSVPNINSDECKIKIFSSYDTSIFDESDSTFSIYKDLVLTSHVGDANWEINTIRKITWTSETSDSIAIELSMDNGVNWISISEGISASEGSFSFLVPINLSTECLIRIHDLHNPLLVDESEVFSIIPQKISLLNPNGGEIWTGDEIQEINWVSDSVNNVRIEYTIDNGVTWTNIISTISADAGSFLWYVPDINSASCKLRITNTEDQWSYDESDSLFEITHSVDIKDELSGSLPTEHQLYQNYPNPFNPSTCIRYDIPEVSFVSLKIYNLSGEEIAVLVNGYKSPGKYQTMFDANKLTSGIYFYSITTNSFTKTCKMILMK